MRSAGAAAISAPTFGRIGRRTSISGTSEPAVGVCLLTEPGMGYPAASLALREKMIPLADMTGLASVYEVFKRQTDLLFATPIP
jgi:hypothetical protein